MRGASPGGESDAPTPQAFDCFIKDERVRIKAERKGQPAASTTPHALSVELTRRWLSLPTEEQQRWGAVARDGAERAAKRATALVQRDLAKAAELEREVATKQRAREEAARIRSGRRRSPDALALRNRRASKMMRSAMMRASKESGGTASLATTMMALTKQQRATARILHENIRRTFGLAGLLAWMGKSRTGFARPDEEGGFGLGVAAEAEEVDEEVGDRIVDGSGGIGGTRRRRRTQRDARRRAKRAPPPPPTLSPSPRGSPSPSRSPHASPCTSPHTSPHTSPNTSLGGSPSAAGAGGADEAEDDADFIYEWLGYLDYSDEDTDEDDASYPGGRPRGARASSAAGEDVYVETLVKPAPFIDGAGELRVRPQRWNLLVDRRQQRSRQEEMKTRKAQAKRMQRMEQAKRDLFDNVESWSTGARGHSQLVQMMGRIDDQMAGVAGDHRGAAETTNPVEAVARWATRQVGASIKAKLRVNMGAVQMCSQWDDRPMMPSLRENFMMTDTVGSQLVRDRYKTEDQYTHRTFNAVADRVSAKRIKLSNSLAQTMTPVMLSAKAKSQPKNATKVFRDGQLVSKVLFFRGGYIVDGMPCIVSVFGIGIHGRVLAVGNAAPRYLLLEAYCSFDGSMTTLQLTLSDIIDALGEAKAGELMIPGKKVELVDAIVSRIRITKVVEEPAVTESAAVFDLAAAEKEASRPGTAATRPGTAGTAGSNARPVTAGSSRSQGGDDAFAAALTDAFAVEAAGAERPSRSRGSSRRSKKSARSPSRHRSASGEEQSRRSRSPSHSQSPARRRKKKPAVTIVMRIAHWSETAAEEAAAAADAAQRDDAAALAMIEVRNASREGGEGRPETGVSTVSIDIVVGGGAAAAASVEPSAGLAAPAGAGAAVASVAASAVSAAAMKKKLKVMRKNETSEERKARKAREKVEKQLRKVAKEKAKMLARGVVDLDAPPPPTDDEVAAATRRAARHAVEARRSIMSGGAPTSMALGIGWRRVRLARVTRRLAGASGAVAIVSVYTKHVWPRVLYCEAYVPSTSAVYPLPVSVVHARRELFESSAVHRSSLHMGAPQACRRMRHIARATDGTLESVLDAVERDAGGVREAFAIVMEFAAILGDGVEDASGGATRPGTAVTALAGGRPSSALARQQSLDEAAADADEDARTWPEDLKRRVARRIAAHVDMRVMMKSGHPNVIDEVALSFNGIGGLPYGVQSAPPRGVVAHKSFSSSVIGVAAATSIIATTEFVEHDARTRTVLRRVKSDGTDEWKIAVRAVKRARAVEKPGRTMLRKALRMMTGEDRGGRCVARGVAQVRLVYPHRNTLYPDHIVPSEETTPQVAKTRGGEWQRQPRRARVIFHVFRRAWQYIPDPLEVEFDEKREAALVAQGAADIQLQVDLVASRPNTAATNASLVDPDDLDDDDDDVGDLFADSAEEDDDEDGSGAKGKAAAADAAEEESSEELSSEDEALLQAEHEAARAERAKLNALVQLAERDDLEIRLFVPSLCFESVKTLPMCDIATMLIGTPLEHEINAQPSILDDVGDHSARVVRALLASGRLHVRPPPPPPADPLAIPIQVAALDEHLAHYATLKRVDEPLSRREIAELPSSEQARARRKASQWRAQRANVLAAPLYQPTIHADRRVLRCVVHLPELPPENEANAEEGALGSARDALALALAFSLSLVPSPPLRLARRDVVAHSLPSPPHLAR